MDRIGFEPIAFSVRSLLNYFIYLHEMYPVKTLSLAARFTSTCLIAVHPGSTVKIYIFRQAIPSAWYFFLSTCLLAMTRSASQYAFS